MPKWGWWLILALFLLGGCANKTAPKAPDRHYIILQDNLPLGTEICVPLILRSETNQYACVPVDFVRWMLRSQTKG